MKKEYDFNKGKRGQMVKTSGKTRITIYIDDDILEAFRSRAEAAGRGYQPMMNEALRASLGHETQTLDAGILRRILREELPGYDARQAPRRRSLASGLKSEKTRRR